MATDDAVDEVDLGVASCGDLGVTVRRIQLGGSGPRRPDGRGEDGRRGGGQDGERRASPPPQSAQSEHAISKAERRTVSKKLTGGDGP